MSLPDKFSDQLIDAVKNAAAFIRKNSGAVDPADVEKKSLNNLVSYVDTTSEQMLVKDLKNIIPQSGFITEENTTKQSQQNEYTWIIDPLDGTTNFLHGIPIYCVSVGLMKNDEMIAGVVHEVNLDECFYSFGAGKSYLNNKEITVSPVSHLRESLIATGFPYTDYHRKHPYMDVFDYCMHHTRGLRRLGSAAADLVYVACGRFEAFWEYGLNAWDIAAGSFIVEQAGGTVSDFNGKRNFLFGEEIIACNALVYDSFLKIVMEKFKTD
ncbi:MAG TPA: inositol monophosphatase family protein [Bacteroidia bacterium]|nr:inositol monophosphatase family protein [Bacteroidia bacterium]HNT79943.1 inositol monophosphatase family protein [Bacteroidia bacterium]